MGKGDKKTAKGKRVIGSYGNVRKRKSNAKVAVVTKPNKNKVEKPVTEKKTTAKKASTAKKSTTKKPTAKKSSSDSK